MGVLITINNEYDNGVCSNHTILTGTTYNIDNATSMGVHTLPYTWDAGLFTGNLFVFIEHCDSHIDPPPSLLPRNQGGFQVQLLTIDCEQCPPIATPEPQDCNLQITVVEMFEPSTDCNLIASFTEFFESTTDCNLIVSFTEFFESTTDCDLTVDFTEFFEVDCSMEITVEEL